MGLRDGRKVGAPPLLASRAKGKRRLFLGSERRILPTVTIGGQGVGKKGRGKGIRFLPTVTIGGEKCVTEREEQKLDATVTVGGQPETKKWQEGNGETKREEQEEAGRNGESEKRQEKGREGLWGQKGKEK